MPPNIGGIFSVIKDMNEMVVNGRTVRLTKYKLMIFDPKDEVSEEDAANIAMYLYEEGFIKKDNFPVEIIKPS